MALLIVCCMSAIYFFSYFERVAIPGTIFDELQQTLRISAGAVSGLGALYMYIYGGMQLLAGAMNDRFGPVRVLLFGGILLAIGEVGFPLAGKLPLSAGALPALYGARTLTALGSSFIYISIVKALDQLFPAEMFPVLLGVVMFVGCAGGLTGTWPLERAVHAWGWQSALLGIGIATVLVVAAGGWVFRRTREITRHVNTFSWRTIPVILRNPSNVLMIIAAPLTFSIYFLMQTVIGKKFLQDYGCMDSPTASLLTLVMATMPMLLALLVSPLLQLSNGRRKPLMVTGIAMALLSVVMLLVGVSRGLTGRWFLLCYVLLGLSTLCSPVSSIIIKELNPSECFGLALGFGNALSYLGVALCSTLAGAILDHYRAQARQTATAIIYPQEAYIHIFLFCLLLLAVAFVCSLFLRETGRVAESGSG